MLRTPVTALDHTRGPHDARVTIVEYGDYECPYCASAYTVLERALTLFPTDVRFVYRHFPLSELHPHAVSAAEIAEAAGAQDQFWDMHAVLYENSQALGLPRLLRYASELRLDLGRIGEELEHHCHMVKLERDFLSGIRSGVHGTPSLFVNNVGYDAPLQLASLAATIDQALDARDELHPH